MTDDFRTDAQQTNRDIYDQLMARYQADPASLTTIEKVDLLMSDFTDMLTTEDQIKRLTAEVKEDFQRRCDRAKAFLDRLEKGVPYEYPAIWGEFQEILPERVFGNCWKIKGLENILKQVYELNYRAVAIIGKPPPTRVNNALIKMWFCATDDL